MLKAIATAYGLLDVRTRRRLPAAAGLGLLVSALEAVGIGLLYPFLLGVSDPSAMPEWARLLAAGLGIEGNRLFAVIGVTAGVMLALKNVVAIAASYWQANFLYEAEGRLSVRLVRAYLEMPFLRLRERNSADMVRNVHGVVGTVTGAFVLPVLNLVTELAMVIATVLVVLAIDITVAVSVGAVLGGAGLLFSLVLRKRLGQLGGESLQANSAVLRSLNHIFGGAKEISVACRQDSFLGEFGRDRDRLTRFRRSQAFLGTLPRYYLELTLLLAVAVAVALVLPDRSQADLMAVMVVFMTAGLRLMPSINRVMLLLQQLRIAVPSVHELEQEFAQARPVALTAPAGDGTPPEANGLRVEKVTFSFPGRQSKVLDAIDLHVAWGETIGLVGTSGAGKTTLVDVILGLYQPDSGRVLVDGGDVFRDLESWRRRIGYIPQDIFLLDDSLRANIAFGIAADKVDEAALMNAVCQAELTDLVASLPGGLDTRLGERGVKMSGGQRQRIGIARALYSDPDILIMDEATSALDNETETRITHTMNALSRRKTLIIIAHRLSTVRQCDRILFLKEGQVAASGDFHSLYVSNEEFANLVRLASLSPEPML